MDTFTIAALISTDTSYLRGILGGIGEFSRSAPKWRIVTRPWLVVDPLAPPPEPCDGAIVYFPAVLERLDPPPAAAVSVSERFGGPGIPLVCPDSEAIGRLGAEHLLSNGFRRFAFVGYPETPFVAARRRGFMAGVREAGMEVHVHSAPSVFPPDTNEKQLTQFINEANPARYWDAMSTEARNEISKWLKELPKPIGLMCATDTFALFVLDCCHRTNISVPGEIAVVGVNNDALACDYANPPLSSVDPNPRTVGYRAAELLDALLCGAEPPAEPVLIPPTGVLVRRSSDCFASASSPIETAMRYIRKHACEPVSVSEIADRCRVPRRTLEKACRRLIGRSPWAEIRRLRLEKARDLLVGTDKTIRRIAEETGFSEGRVLTSVFHKHIGITPTEFRRQHGAKVRLLHVTGRETDVRNSPGRRPV